MMEPIQLFAIMLLADKVVSLLKEASTLSQCDKDMNAAVHNIARHTITLLDMIQARAKQLQKQQTAVEPCDDGQDNNTATNGG